MIQMQHTTIKQQIKKLESKSEVLDVQIAKTQDEFAQHKINSELYDQRLNGFFQKQDLIHNEIAQLKDYINGVWEK